MAREMLPGAPAGTAKPRSIAAALRDGRDQRSRAQLL
jgi:hypothetical protein